MTKIKQTHQFVALYRGSLTAFGQDESIDKAVGRLCRELKECGVVGLSEISFMIYVCPIGNQVSWGDEGVKEVCGDEEIGFAIPAHYISDCVIARPLTTMRLHNWREGYRDGGEAIAELLGDRAPE